jgi:hypothetical protein
VRPGEAAAQVLGDQVRIFRRHQIREPAIDEIHAVDADETRELAVRVQDDVAMYQHRFVDALAKFGEQFRTGFFPARGARGAQQKLVDRHADGLHVELSFELLCELDALGQTFAADGALNGERQLGDRAQVAPLEKEQHE